MFKRNSYLPCILLVLFFYIELMSPSGCRMSDSDLVPVLNPWCKKCKSRKLLKIGELRLFDKRISFYTSKERIDHIRYPILYHIVYMILDFVLLCNVLTVEVCQYKFFFAKIPSCQYLIFVKSKIKLTFSPLIFH